MTIVNDYSMTLLEEYLILVSLYIESINFYIYIEVITSTHLSIRTQERLIFDFKLNCSDESNDYQIKKK